MGFASPSDVRPMALLNPSLYGAFIVKRFLKLVLLLLLAFFLAFFVQPFVRPAGGAVEPREAR
jgi:hypothetical protein